MEAIDITETATTTHTFNSVTINKSFMQTQLHWAIRLRKRLLIQGSWKWNAWVRDITAKMESWNMN